LSNTKLEIPEEDGQQVIVLSHILLHKLNYGYQHLANFQVLIHFSSLTSSSLISRAGQLFQRNKITQLVPTSKISRNK
jgi:PDZ domain